MKKVLAIFTTAVIIILGFLFSAKGADAYILTITKGKIIKQNNQTYWLIPTTLTNNSRDTLRYFSMSCSWQEFYYINNDKLEIETSICDKNIPIILTLAPNQSRTVEIKLLIDQTIDASQISFKIGLSIMKASKSKAQLDFDYNEELKKSKIIWSNIISM